jgi:hypothetical protein
MITLKAQPKYELLLDPVRSPRAVKFIVLHLMRLPDDVDPGDRLGEILLAARAEAIERGHDETKADKIALAFGQAVLAEIRTYLPERQADRLN